MNPYNGVGCVVPRPTMGYAETGIPACRLFGANGHTPLYAQSDLADGIRSLARNAPHPGLNAITDHLGTPRTAEVCVVRARVGNGLCRYHSCFRHQVLPVGFSVPIKKALCPCRHETLALPGVLTDTSRTTSAPAHNLSESQQTGRARYGAGSNGLWCFKRSDIFLARAKTAMEVTAKVTSTDTTGLTSATVPTHQWQAHRRGPRP